MAHDLAAALARARSALAPPARKSAPPSLADRARTALARLRAPMPAPTAPARVEGRPVLDNAHVGATKGDGGPITAGDLGPGAAPPQVAAGSEKKPPMLAGTRQLVAMGYLEVGEDGTPRPSKALLARAAKDAAAGGETTASADGLPPKLVDFGGIPVLIDRPKGFVQTKTDEDGNVLWTRTYEEDYGGLAGTDGGDHEDLDFFAVDPKSKIVWWAVQVDDSGAFDEYKLIGVETEEEARRVFLAHIPEKYLASLTPMPTDRLRALLGLPIPDRDAALKAAPVLDLAKPARAAKAIAGAVTYTGNTKPAEQAPADVRAIVETAALSWRYPSPDDVGGWLGAIEPADERWIAFVDVAGKVLLWTEREPQGGTQGEPFLLWRPDLARPNVELIASTKAATPEEQFIFGIVLKPERVDIQREIYAPKVVRKTAHDFLAYFRNTDLQHKVFINEAVELVECTVEKVAFWMARDGTAYPADPGTGVVIGAPAGAQLRFVPQGAWTVAHRIKDPELWAAIKRGEFTGYSINGLKRLARPATG